MYMQTASAELASRVSRSLIASILVMRLTLTGEGSGLQGLPQAMANQMEAVTKLRHITSASRFQEDLRWVQEERESKERIKTHFFKKVRKKR